MSNAPTVRHALNVSNFAILVESCAAMGPEVYRPTRLNLKLGALQDALKNAQNAMADFQLRHVDLSKAMEARDHGFADFDTKITRIFHALKACTNSVVTDERAAQLIRKIRGTRNGAAVPTPTAAVPTPTAAVPTPTAAVPSPTAAVPATTEAAAPEKGHHAKSHTSQQDLIDNTRELLQFLRATEGYAPEEEDLKLDALNAWLANLTMLVDLLRTARIAHDRARETRNHALYAPVVGIVDLANDCKSYLRSLHGSQHPEYMRIARLEFRSLS